MSFSRGKQKYSRDELIDILKRNASVYKDDEVFTQYVIDLATFLVEYRVRVSRETAPEAESDTGRLKRQWISRTQDRDEELEKVLRKHATAARPDATCKMCGAPTHGKMTCPHCGNMTI